MPGTFLRVLVGRYVSPELDRSVLLVVEEGVLLARYRSEDLELETRMEDVFSAKAATFSMKRDDEDNVIGFLLDAGRVRNLRYHRK